MLTNAHSQADQIIRSAHARGEILERDTQEQHRLRMGALITEREELERRIDDLRAYERDAQERHHQTMGVLVTARENLERRVDDLRAFEREYRARLKAYFEGQLRDLEAPRVLALEAQPTLARVEELRAFENQYRSRLQAYLQRQLHDLEAGSKELGTSSALPSAES